MFTQRQKRKERLKSTSSSCSNGNAGGSYNNGFDEANLDDFVNGDGATPQTTTATKMASDDRLQRRLLLIVLLASGAMLASFVGFWSADGRFAKSLPINARSASALLPDAHHLEIVDESDPVMRQSLARKGGEFVVSYDVGDDTEALKSLQAALLLKKKNHVEKAKKVFLHALALSPKNPTVLNCYGEFLVETDRDMVVEADHLFTKALIYSFSESGEHTRALANRQRTGVLVEEIDGRFLAGIDDKKKALQKINHSTNAALRRAKKEAYFQHVHHSVGIEGNTMTLAQTRSILETKLAVGGKSIVEHNEVLGLDAALKYINQTLVDRVTGDIRLEDILEIHKRVVGFSDPLEAGAFRETQVYVGDHVPPPADHVEQLMERFVGWLNSAEALTMHPVRLAALAHYKLVYIHPFVDGNGRTSRLLMNLILMHHGFPPVIVRKEDRLAYYQYLVTANSGDVRPFVRFVAGCTERTLNAYLVSSGDHSLAPFTMHDAERIPKSSSDMLEHHDKIVMGGMVVEPTPNNNGTGEP